MSRPVKQPVYLIIPAHNRREVTLRCLAALSEAGDISRYHAVVVDDGSTDGTSEAIRSAYPDVDILAGTGDLWWTGAIVLGMCFAMEAGAEHFVWLNDDCLVRPDTIAHLVAFVRENPGSIMGAQGIEPDQSEAIAFGGKRRTWKGFRFVRAPEGQYVPCEILSGNLVCMPREVVDAIGYPDVQVTPHYGGDALYMLRAFNAGFRLYVDGRTSVTGISGERPLYPAALIAAPGGPLRLLQLAFQKRSGLSWRLWMVLYWEGYGLWGLVMWSKRQAEIIGATCVRFLPLQVRRRLTGSTR